MGDGAKGCLMAIGIFFLVVVLMIIGSGLGIFGTYLNFGSRWVTAPTEMFSVDNVRELSRQANDMFQQLKADQVSIRSLENQITTFEDTYGEDTNKWPQGKLNEYQQLQRALYNKKASYNDDCGQYNALWKDEWRDLPAPDDLQKTCELIE